MRKLLVMLIALLLVPAAMADPGNGNGKGTCKQNNKQCLKWCGEPPAGCTYFECTRCGCDFLCGDGTLLTLPSLAWELDDSPGGVVQLESQGTAPAASWSFPFAIKAVRWPVPLK